MIKFSSKSSGDFQMLDAHGNALLALIGKGPAPRGVITPEQIPAAIAKISAASAADQADSKRHAKAQPEGASETEEPISLGQRAFPLLDMLRRAQAAGEPVLWGV
jgi:hypothetical protein